MRRPLHLLAFFWALLFGTTLLGQNIELTLRYNLALSRFEVYARPDASNPAFTWGPSQISIVVPAAVPNSAMSVTGVNAGAWIDNTRVYAPAADPAHDFHAVGSSGDLTNLVNGQETLLFHFNLPGGNCVSGIRLFINASDPNSSAPGMLGGDYLNTIDNGMITDVYIGNYDDDPIVTFPQDTINATICEGSSYILDTRILTTSGTYTDTLDAAIGCDTLVTLNLTVLPISRDTLDVSICEGDSYTFGAQSLNSTGTYTDTLTAANACDSIITLNLNVIPLARDSISASICEGSTYTFGAQVLSVAGVYSDTLSEAAANGCDSIITLTLSILPIARDTLSVAICEGSTYTFDGQNLSVAGTYADTLTAANGCDSILTLNLSILPIIRDTLDVSICEDASYTFDGQNLNTAGTYVDTLTAVNGCDSIVTLNLSILPIIRDTLDASICEGDTYTFGAQILSAAGTYSHTSTAANGCDSIVTLNLTLRPLSRDTITASICEGDTYTFGAQVLSAAGTYADTLVAANACDSIVTLELTVLPASRVTIRDTIIIGSTYDFGGEILSQQGTYLDTLLAANSCDSIVTLILSVIDTNELSCGCYDLSVSLNAQCQFVLTANHVSDAYCPGAFVRVMDNDPSNGDTIDCAGVWVYGLFDAQGNIICWGKVTAEDKTAPAILCTNWTADTLDCFDVNYVLNNRLTIGNVNYTSSPRPSANSAQTIPNAEGIPGEDGAATCDLVPPALVADNVLNLGYTYFKDNCRDCGCRTTIKWSDRVVYYNCTQMAANGGIYARIYRSWTATDCNGMLQDTVQEINFKRPALEDFVFNGSGEGKYDRVVTYNACSPDKNLIKKEDVTPYICSYFNTSNNPRCLLIDQVECNYSVQIKDTEFPICNGKGLKIDRQLYVFDWCAGGIVDTFHILIKIGDFEAPALEYAHHAPFDISTGPMDCTAAIPTTVAGIKAQLGVTIKDNCTLGNVSVSVKTKDRYVKGILVAENVWEKVDYAVMNGMMLGLPVGRHRLIIDASDGCYNAKKDSFEFNVVDKIAPVMKCDDDLHVTLSNANGYTNGYAQVSAEDVDEGSWDNCKLAWIAVRRNVPDACTASFIAKGYDTNGNGKLDALPADGDLSKADGFDRNGDGDLADFGETFILKGGKLMTPLLDFAEFFCCDLTERVTLELWGEDVYGNTNYCWMDLLIEDKVAPTCLAPWALTIDCDDKRLGQIDDKKASALAFGDVSILSGNDCADLDTVYTVVKKLKCGAGTIERIWTLSKQTAKGPISITCSQIIKVLPIREYNICFPKDASSDCKTPLIDTVLTDELACDILAVNVSDKRYDASDDECYKIFRTYTVIDWCAYNDACGDPMSEGHVYVVDRATFENYGKAAVYVLVRDENRDQNEEFYLSKDLIPKNTGDIQFTPPFCEVSAEYYHSFMYTQIIKVYDSERPAVTGVRDTFCTSPTACTANISKVVRIQDNCTNEVTLETQYLMIAPFQTLDAGKMILYSTPRWSTKDLGNGQFEISVSNLPEGTHDLIVVGRDECGNLSVATRIPFVVKDCKAPAPICINGLSTELMPDGNGGGMMSVWAKDFVASPIYDCNGQDPRSGDPSGRPLITKYSINRVGETARPDQTGLTLNCADAGKTVLIELHAWDERGNHDFCVTFIEVQDNRKICVGSATNFEISGLITTDELEPVLGVEIDLSGGAERKQNTAANGTYLFGNLAKDNDYTVTAQLDKDHLNGVSTFDLVLIQKHILGVKVLDNPYRMIAADVNNSHTISTLDMIQIRKLILNIDLRFNNVPSWKFVDASYRFPDAVNPWSAAFPEVININDLAGKVKADFVAIKMGDVNGNASTTGAIASEIRGVKNLILNAEEQVLQKGQTYDIAIRAKDLAQIQGFQFTLQVSERAEIIGLDYGLMTAENFGLFQNEGTITTSFVRAPLAGAPISTGALAQGYPKGMPLLFILKLKANVTTNLSEVLNINSRLTHAEAYNQDNEVMDLKLDFYRTENNDQVSLYQNTPNPFSDETIIEFYLPTASRATLSIRDVKGALLYQTENDYPKGNHQVRVKQAQLQSSGVMYYTLQTNDFTGTQKMILLNQ